MSDTAPMLHMICGKIAAGKSTLAASLAAAPNTVLISEDAWLGALFADQMATPRDYVQCASKLRHVMGPHIVALLRADVSVVLDFPANTIETRQWMRGILDESGAQHRLHVLSPPDAVCLERLALRNAKGDHPFKVSETQFYAVTQYFVPPTPEEGFDVMLHDQAD